MGQFYFIMDLKKLFIVLITTLSCVTGSGQVIDSVSTNQLFDMSLQDLMNIDFVTASGQQQNIIEAPSVVSVITSEEIISKGYNSVAEALKNVSGIFIETDHFQPNLSIRGINGGMRSWSRLVKVMIDGQPVPYRMSYNNFLDESLIPVEAIARIEIIRGPNSAIFGRNAFLGVINIITKNGDALNHPAVSGYTSIKEEEYGYGTNFFIGSSSKNFEWLLSSSISKNLVGELKPLNVPGSTIYDSADIAKNNERNPFGTYLKLKYKNQQLGTFMFDLSYQEIDSKTTFQDWGILKENNRINFVKYYERLSWERSFGKSIDASLFFSNSNGYPTSNEIMENDNNLSDWIIREAKYNAYDVNSIVSYKIDNINNLSLGVDYSYEKYKHQTFYEVNTNNNKVEIPGGSYGQDKFTNLGIYLQMIFNPAVFFNLNYLRDLTFTAGYRVDFHNIYGDVFNYRLAGVYKISEKYSTKLMYGTSFNAPSSNQLYSNPMFSGDLVGNPDLEPEKAKTLEWSLIGILEDYLQFDLNLFYSEIENKIEYVLPYGDISNITSDNISNIYSAGLESNIRFEYQQLSAYLNYSYQKSVSHKNHPLFGDIQTITNLYPAHLLKFGTTCKWPEYFVKFDLDGRYVSKRLASEQNNFIYDPINYAINGYYLDPYWVFDLRVSTMNVKLVRNKETIISLCINNILNSDIAYPGYKDYDIPGLGRYFNFKVIQTF